MAEKNVDVLNEVRAAANNTLGLFSEDIVENFLRDIDEEALTQLSETGESSEQATVFKQADDVYIQQLVDKNANKNTKRTTQTWIRRFDAWRAERGISNPLHEIPRENLNTILKRFYAEVVKENGDEYEPDCLKTMLASLDRHLKEHGALFSIRADQEFEESRKVLNGRAKEIRESGKGKKPMKAEALTEEEEQLLWERKGLGDEDPRMLNRTIFYTLGQQFGTRGRQEHHDIYLEHLKFVKNPKSGATEYVEWTEGITKTRQGGLHKPGRMMAQKAFAVGGPKCPVALLEKMIAKRPPSLKNSGPLYLQPLRKPKPSVWYSVQRLGINQIASFMDEIKQSANLDVSKRITNHSVRKTLVKKLKKAGVSNTEIIAITGHKSEDSLKHYDEVDIDDHRRISKCISSSSDAKTMEVPDNHPGCSAPLPSYSATHYTSSTYGWQWPSYPLYPSYPHPPVSTNPLPQAPVYNFSGCTVYLGSNDCLASETPPKRHCPGSKDP